ncbi:MAG: DUF5666 domain-containing protein, partial [Pseudomonadota bacterium]|nr:DUF5666 domain-containing protein [Pseudomonadota bacterium]
MKLKTKLTALASTLAISIAGCGGGGDSTGDTAGIGGSGFISSGTITGFGSVYVNGVKFETDSATFDIEGDSSGTTQNDLAIGMVVRVNGTINPDGITGNATSIIFDDELQGPVSGLTNPTPDTAEFTVLGTTVKIDRNLTSFDGTGFSFDTIANNDNIEISGFFDSTGVLTASRVELEDDAFVAGVSIVEIKGNLSTVDNINYTLNGLIISITGDTNIDDFPSGLADGIRVEVKGTFNGTDTITAIKIESEELNLDDSDEFELEGYITDFNSSADFKINGIPVDASSATFEPYVFSLTNDLQVEAEGPIINGVLKAEEIKLRGGDVKIAAYISAVSTDTFTVSPGDGVSAITIDRGTETELKNEITGDESLNVVFNVGDFVQIEGFETGTDSMFAA